MWEMIQKGGPVMYPIILCSIAALAIVIERSLYLYRVRTDVEKFMEQIAQILKRNRVMEAIDFCEKTTGPIARIVKAGILNHDRPRQEIKESIEDAGIYEIPQLQKHLGMLATIAHISPLLGLLGTVTGMVRAFQVIQQKATALNPVNPADLAGGIWEALITTVGGLVVAIPAFVVYDYLVHKVKGFVHDMDRAATELVNILSRRSDEY
ncbi:MAG: MotA/TolQ/ExbB proton channel family protein [Candidatus Omnitrophota bacterium]